MRVEFDTEELEGILVNAAPPDGQPWKASDIAKEMAKHAADAAVKLRDEEWEAGRGTLATRFQNSGVQPGDAAAVDAMRERAKEAVKLAVDQKIASNTAVASVVGKAVFLAATAAMGGAALPALVPMLMPAATMIAGAMNGPDAAPPSA